MQSRTPTTRRSHSDTGRGHHELWARRQRVTSRAGTGRPAEAVLLAGAQALFANLSLFEGHLDLVANWHCFYSQVWLKPGA
jgi:hypothetical protein